MPSRRVFLAAAAASLLVPAATARAGIAAPRVAIRAYGDFYIVNGWMLTRSDLAELGIDAG